MCQCPNPKHVKHQTNLKFEVSVLQRLYNTDCIALCLCECNSISSLCNLLHLQ